MIFKKGYQKVGPIASSTVIKVKGVTFTKTKSKDLPEMYRRIWDTSDLISSDNDAFFVTTNVITTPNQTRTTCSEVLGCNNKVEVYIDVGVELFASGSRS